MIIDELPPVTLNISCSLRPWAQRHGGRGGAQRVLPASPFNLQQRPCGTAAPPRDWLSALSATEDFLPVALGKLEGFVSDVRPPLYTLVSRSTIPPSLAT